MVQEQLLRDEPVENAPPPAEQGLKLRVILKFIAWWLGSLLILIGIALLTNIEWARRHIEASLCQSFHREVHLGRLSWSLGLQGLAIDTDRFEMKGQKGEPFISSGPSEIGIAVLPLLQRKLVIRHLEFKKPEVWAVKLDSKKWNFSDLLTEGPEIHMVQIENGQLHLRNVYKDGSKASDPSNDWASYDAKDIKLSLTLPRGNRNWPVYLFCKIPLKTESAAYESEIRLSATGKGAFNEWQQNNYHVDLQVQKFDPDKFRPLWTSLPKIKGICDLQFKGEGVFNQGFVATVDGAMSKLDIQTVDSKQLEIEKAACSTKLLLNPEAIQWQDLKLTLGQWELGSNGKLLNWQNKTPAYEAKVGGKLTDLKGFFGKVISRFMPKSADPKNQFTNVKLDKMCKAEKNGELCGTASIELLLKGDKNENNVSTNIKADGIPLAQLVDNEMGNNLFNAFKLDPSAPIKGELNIDPGKRLELKDLEIPVEDSKIILSGFIEQETGKTELEFKADNLGFDTFKKRLGTDNPIIKAICSSNGKSKPYAIAGALDLKGRYVSDGTKPSVFVDANLKGLRLTRAESSSPVCSGIKGRIIYKDDLVEVKQLTGVTAGSSDTPAGDFRINGSFKANDAGRSDMELNAHEVSIAQLKDWLNRFGVNLQQPGFDKLAGSLHELNAQISTRNKQTTTSFTINPADLLINLGGKSEGAAQQFRLSSGVISYASDELTANEVQLASRGGRLTLWGSMQGKLEALKFKSCRLKTDGFELSDLHSILKGNLSSGKTSPSQLPEFMTPSSSSSLHGKVYGEMQFGDGISGVIGFNNAGGKFGKNQTNVEKLTGVAVISKDQLVLQDTTGQIGKSTFALDGVISNYVSSNVSWQGQLRGHFYQGEVDDIINNLGHGIALSSSTMEPLNLRVTGNGNKDSAALTFRGRASSTYGAHLKTAFGTFHQPKARPLTFSGGLNLNNEVSELSLSNFQMHSGNEILHAGGSFKWANETAEKPASLSFSLNTPNPVKSSTLTEIISQNTSDQPSHLGGTSQLNLKVEGPVNDLVLSGVVLLDKNSLPDIRLENLSGKIDLPGWHLNKVSGADSSSIAKLQLKTLSMGGVPLHDIAATLSLDAGNRIFFKECQAYLSGGKATLSGFFNPQNQSYHTDISVSKLVVDDLVKDLIDHSGGVTGLADIALSLESTGGDSPRNITGTGQFNVYQGSVASFGKLQEKLNEANLLQQGLFGFNVNNLLQAMMPVNSGQFNEISGKFNIGKGTILFDQIRFEGANLRMRAAGKFDFLAKTIDVDVAGDIPRVSSSIIPGAIGEMSRKVTLQRVFRIVTFKKLKDLPALPLLGDIANDDPRAFTFSVETSTEPPKLITQAVEKSFKWLPNKPFASAHPVPGI